MDKRAKDTLDNFQQQLDDFRKSNPTGKQVQSANIRMIVADARWQRIRSALVGNWMKNPMQSLKVLQLYVGDMKDPIKVRQVLNYITGTAFRIGKINSPELEEFRDDIRQSWERLIK